jgi:hypothetical protein
VSGSAGTGGPAAGTTVALAGPTPAVDDPGRPPDELIGPGIAGFVAIFLLAAAVILLIRDMNRRVRRLRHREAARPEATGDRSDRPDAAPEGGAAAREAGDGADRS